MKINVELDEDEEILLEEAFESAIVEVLFADESEISEEERTEYFLRLQELITKLGFEISVQEIVEELIELNEEMNKEMEEE